MRNEHEIFNNKGISYLKYRELIENLLAQNLTSGPDQSQQMVDYTKMNLQRMNRIDKTTILNQSLIEYLKDTVNELDFLVITEAWCGDAAQITPVLNKIAENSNGKLNLKFVLRDENIDLMDNYLTHGGRAIPILIIMNKSGKVVGKWGPRPAILQELMVEWKKETADMWELSTKIHAWYAKDKTNHIQQEIEALLKKLN
ncbi:thioredoxin family protein [Pedobacter flavus]|uniref:Thioredoxin family protein n=1 Tax=Pedobacter flavus TaxID=3113906 RepID=A0ABU7GYS3_9SPHI|nr:thioredoxin family protein [Pedobacter sp. VNH31]MEE1884233.1 thioredoxin family protein [Pedobacter sp. VNH31]